MRMIKLIAQQGVSPVMSNCGLTPRSLTTRTVAFRFHFCVLDLAATLLYFSWTDDTVKYQFETLWLMHNLLRRLSWQIVLLSYSHLDRQRRKWAYSCVFETWLRLNCLLDHCKTTKAESKISQDTTQHSRLKVLTKDIYKVYLDIIDHMELRQIFHRVAKIYGL